MMYFKKDSVLHNKGAITLDPLKIFVLVHIKNDHTHLPIHLKMNGR